jgi:hypothetical protein
MKNPRAQTHKIYLVLSNCSPPAVRVVSGLGAAGYCWKAVIVAALSRRIWANWRRFPTDSHSCGYASSVRG